jgi:hypothetical protein
MRGEYRGKRSGYTGYFAYKGYSGSQCLEGGCNRKNLNYFTVKEREEGRGQSDDRRMNKRKGQLMRQKGEKEIGDKRYEGK